MTTVFKKHKFYRGTSFCTLERELVLLWGSVVITAAGAVYRVKGMGIDGVTKTGTGKYKIQLDQKYFRYIGGKIGFVHATGSGIATVEVRQAPATLQATFQTDATIEIECLDFAGAPANPADGSVMGIELWVRNSSAGPADA